MRTYTLRVEDPADDPDALTEAIEELERRGFKVECTALTEWTRRRKRDEHLREAHALMDADKTTWGKCQQLALQIGKFEERWPRWRDYETVPESFGALGRCLFRARKCGSLPTTPQQLANIMAKFNGPCNLVERPVSSATDSE